MLTYLSEQVSNIVIVLSIRFLIVRSFQKFLLFWFTLIFKAIFRNYRFDFYHQALNWKFYTCKECLVRKSFFRLWLDLSMSEESKNSFYAAFLEQREVNIKNARKRWGPIGVLEVNRWPLNMFLEIFNPTTPSWRKILPQTWKKGTFGVIWME